MNRRIAYIVLVLAFALSACAGGPRLSAGDSQATAVALAGTQAALTLASLPTLTLPPSNTPLPTFTNTAAPSATKPTNTATLTPETNTTPGTGTPAVTSTLGGTSMTGTGTSTVTATGTVSGTVTAIFTPTPGVLLWGTVPPEVPFSRVHLVNLTNEMVYISFHCTLENGLTSYLEYPVYARMTVSIPIGPCHYVAWVKGTEFIGDIRIKKAEEYTFTFKKSKILITQP